MVSMVYRGLDMYWHNLRNGLSVAKREANSIAHKLGIG